MPSRAPNPLKRPPLAAQNLQDKSLAMQAQDEEVRRCGLDAPKASRSHAASRKTNRLLGGTWQVARMQEHLLSHSMRQKGGGGSLAYSR